MSRRAFTLLELLIAISVVAILAAMLFPLVNLLRFQARCLDTTHRMDAITQGLTTLDYQRQGPAFALHRSVVLPATGLGVLRFAILTGGADSDSGER